MILSLVGWKFWENNRKPFDVHIVGVGHKVVDESLGNKGYVLPKIDAVNKMYDLIAHIDTKSSPAVLYCGKVGTGKSTLMAWTIWEKTDSQECETFGRVSEKVVIFSPKTWHDRKDYDFDLPNFRRIDMTQFLPSNVFENHHAFVGSILTALYADLTARGMMSHSVRTQLYELVSEGGIKSWADFEDKIDKARKGRGNFDMSILNAIRGDIQFLKGVGKEGTLQIDWSDMQENYVLDFGVFEDNDIAKVFYMEYFLRAIFKHKTKNILAIDEIHRLLNKGETSILSKVLREGRTGIKLYLATQNFSDVPNANVQFGSIFAHETQNVDDYKASADEFVKDYWKMLRGHRFIDLTDEHHNSAIPIYELNPERLNQVRECERDNHVGMQSDENFTVEESSRQKETEDDDNKADEKYAENIIETLRKSEVCLYGYEIAKSVGLSPKDAIKIRQPLRQLKDVKIREWKCQIRNKEVTYYYLINDGRDVCHNFMTRETKKKFGDWKIIFEASQGTGGADFIIEKDNKKIAIECETGLKKEVLDVQERITKNLADVIDTVIVVPTEDARQFYSALFDCRVCLIPELEEILENWTR